MFMLSRAPHRASSLPKKLGWYGCDGKAEQVLELADGDDDRDTNGEAVDDRFRHEAHQPASPQVSTDQQDHARHERRQHQPVISMICNHAIDDDNKCPGWPTNLDSTAPRSEIRIPATMAVTRPCPGMRQTQWQLPG
jgi:hypothetical protein